MFKFRNPEAEDRWVLETYRLGTVLRPLFVSWLKVLERRIEKELRTLGGEGVENPSVCLALDDAVRLQIWDLEQIEKCLDVASRLWIYGERFSAETYTYKHGWATLEQVVLREAAALKPWSARGDYQRSLGATISPWRPFISDESWTLRPFLQRYYTVGNQNSILAASIAPWTGADAATHISEVRWYEGGEPNGIKKWYGSLAEVQMQADSFLVERGILPTKEATLVWDSDLPLSHAIPCAIDSGLRFVVGGSMNTNHVRDLKMRRTGLVYSDLFPALLMDEDEEPDARALHPD